MSRVLVLLRPLLLQAPPSCAPGSMMHPGFGLLTGQVDDLAEAPIRPVGEQSAFISGIAAACAGMHAAQAGEPGAVVDVSIQEALATLAMGELTSAGLAGRSRSRKRLTDGNGATVCILPARDGYAAMSPREDRQWGVMARRDGLPRVGE